MKTMSSVLAATVAVLLPASALLAQDAPSPEGDRDRGDRRRSFNPEEFRKRMNERLKEALKATDEEWTAIEPMVAKVQEKLMASRGGGFGGRPPGSERGSRGEGDRERGRGGSPETQALRDVLEKESSSAEEIKAKLDAVRAQRRKAHDELEAARAELKSVLTTRQEAVLVAFGMLE